MLADGAERPDRTVVAAHHEHRFARDVRRQTIARLGHLFDPADADPAATEHFGLLEGEELRRRVAAGRQHPLLHRTLIQRSHFREQGFDHGRSELASPGGLGCESVHMRPPNNHFLTNEVGEVARRAGGVMSISPVALDPSARCAGTSPSRIPRRGGEEP